MLSILVNWLYTGVLVFLCGTALIQGYKKLIKIVDKEVKRIEFGVIHIFFTGILGTTLYAQVFSLFYRVNIESNILLIILLAVYGIIQRGYLREQILSWIRKPRFLPENKRLRSKERWLRSLFWFSIIAAVFAFALSSSGTAKLIDTDWYHAQTIRWIEEYGCVKGVANLFPALGYNNAQHYFDALFSLNWAFGQSIRGSGGFFGLLMFIHGIQRVFQWKKHSRHMADALALWEVAYSIIVTAFFADPYVDTLPNVLTLFIMTEWLAHLEEQKENIAELGFYSLLAVFAAVCKMSVAMVVLLAFHPACLLMKQKKVPQILLFLGLGILIALPFLITNVVTTGYLIYLLSAVDLFEVNWKMDIEILKYSVDSMVAFARMPLATMEEALNSGLKWIPVWFKAESISHQLLYITILAFVLYDILMTLGSLLKKEKIPLQMLWPRICVYLGLVYWFITIPQVKYCWAFLIIPVAVIPVYYWEKGKHTWIKGGMLAAALGLFVMYGGFYSLRTLGYMKDGILHYPVMQADYGRYDFEAVKKDEHTFYVRKENGDIACGYYVFPYLDNRQLLDSLVVGESLGDGFYLEK